MKAVGNEDEIKKSVDYKFIDMYPIFPTVDLKTESIYEENSCIGWYSNIEEELKRKLNNPFKFIHTIFDINDNKFNVDEDESTLIMFAFGYAHAQVTIVSLISTNRFFTSMLLIKVTKKPYISLTTLPNGDLASGSWDNTIKIWNLNNACLTYYQCLFPYIIEYDGQ